MDAGTIRGGSLPLRLRSRDREEIVAQTMKNQSDHCCLDANVVHEVRIELTVL
jgi:hypothetical protein